MSNDTKQAVQSKTDSVEFIPFGGDKSIKLSLAIIKQYVCIPTKSGAVCSERDAMRFMMLCRSRSLNPFEGDCFLQGYDTKNGPEFSLITAHQAFLKRAELNAEFDGKESGVIVMDKDGKVLDRVGDFTLDEDALMGGWCTVHFKNRKFPQKERVHLRAYNKGWGRWEVDAAGMIVKCAESAALRSAFPTQLGGLYSREELRSAFPEEIPRVPDAELRLVPTAEDESAEAAAGLAPSRQNIPSGAEVRIDEERQAKMKFPPPVPTISASARGAVTASTEPDPNEQLARLCAEHRIDFDQFRSAAARLGWSYTDLDSTAHWLELKPLGVSRLLIRAGAKLIEEIHTANGTTPK